ncbi:MAG: RNA-binding protein [Deltaproteobacteria bacterium]|nr:RNA-binding protein [Deltaproteobacteria bacterium]
MPSRLFIGGLAWRVTTDQLRTEFEKIGAVNDAVVVLDRDTGDSRGFGFVTMADRKDAAEAIRKLHGQDLEGRALVVRQATERSR